MTCQYASSGCNSPEGECLDICMHKEKEVIHPNHRDHIQAIQAKRLREDLDDDEASHIEELLAADQQRQKEQPQYREERME